MTEDRNKDFVDQSDNKGGQSVVEPGEPLAETSLAQLPELIQKSCSRAGWTELMPVQAKTIPYVLDERDLMVQSRTGSGKTGAFILPILERIRADRPECQALVLVPTRELALQVAKDAEVLAAPFGIRTVAVYGGVGYGLQMEGFRAGAHLVVGTPGRILDHLLKRNLSLQNLQILVFDEADRLLSMGFYPDMKQVQRYLPRRQINGYMFSATFPHHVLRLANEFLYRPELLSLSRDHVHVTETEHLYYIVPPMEKDRCLVRIIEMENPHSAIIFCNTKVTVQYVSAVLQRFGYDADQLSADLTQKQRDKVMNRVRKGTLRFLVATDVAARGIDIPDLSHVFLYEPPQDVELYIHRAGRTGRAGASGQAISLVAKNEVSEIRKIGERYSIEFIERPLPDDADVAALVSQRVIALLEARLRDRDKLQTERMQRFVPLARALAESEDETAVIAMLVDDYYQETLHGKPDTPPTEAPPDKKPAGNGRRQSGSGGKRGRSDRTRKH